MKWLIFVLLCMLTVNMFGKVEIKNIDEKFNIFRNEKLYTIKGLSGFSNLKKAKEIGANSILLYSDNLDNIEFLKEKLDEAKKVNITVSIILGMGLERKGFDYSNNDMVSNQFLRIEKIVTSLKDHSALLMWGVGNELHLDAKKDNFYSAIEDIAKMIKNTDSNHPIFTTISELNSTVISNIIKYCPSLDLLGVNSYGGVNSIADRLKTSQWNNKPVIITEWGPTGHWELGNTRWGAPIEQTSGEKALNYEARYPTITNSGIIVGSFAFYWGYKQEVTPTWYSLFSGDMTMTCEAVDYIQNAFSSKFPKNRAPSLLYVAMNDTVATENIGTTPSQTNTIFVEVSDPENDKLKYNIYVTKESISKHIGGDYEPELEKVDIGTFTKETIHYFISPKEKGYYRVFVIVTDGHNHFASANIPFEVK